MWRSIISETRDSNLSFTGTSLRMDFLSQLLPPAFEGTVTYEEFGFQLIRRDDSNRSRAGKEVRRKRRIFDPLRLNVKGCQDKQNNRPDHPSSNETERCPEQLVRPLQFGTLHESGDQPRDNRTRHQRSNKNQREAQE